MSLSKPQLLSYVDIETMISCFIPCRSKACINHFNTSRSSVHGQTCMDQYKTHLHMESTYVTTSQWNTRRLPNVLGFSESRRLSFAHSSSVDKIMKLHSPTTLNRLRIWHVPSILCSCPLFFLCFVLSVALSHETPNDSHNYCICPPWIWDEGMLLQEECGGACQRHHSEWT